MEKSNSLFIRFTSWIVDKPILTLLLLVVITTVAVIGHVNPWLISDLFKSANERQSVVRQSISEPDVEAFDINGHAVLMVKCDSIFTSKGTVALRAIVEALSLIHI